MKANKFFIISFMLDLYQPLFPELKPVKCFFYDGGRNRTYLSISLKREFLGMCV